MFSVNKAILVGTLGADPEIRNTQNGNSVANLRVATEESWKDKSSGEWKKKVEWHKVTAWGPFAKQADKLKKGDKVYVEGAIQTRKWQDQGGQDKYSTEVVVQGFGNTLIGFERNSNGSSGNSGSGSNGNSRGPATSNDMDDEIPF
jgi:single-strand DNA-binding protein